MGGGQHWKIPLEIHLLQHRTPPLVLDRITRGTRVSLSGHEQQPVSAVVVAERYVWRVRLADQRTAVRVPLGAFVPPRIKRAILA